MQILPLNSASDGFLVTKLCPSSNAVMLLKCKRTSKNSFHSPYHNILASFCFYFTLLCLKFDGWCGNIQIYTGLKTQPAFSTLFSHILHCFRQTKQSHLLWCMLYYIRYTYNSEFLQYIHTPTYQFQNHCWINATF